MHTFGPQPLPHTQRMAIAHEIAQRLKERFPREVFAIGLYGSLAREEDGPYSDIEIFAVMRAEQYEHCYEWCTAEWKAEVDLYGTQTLCELAARVNGQWPLTHGAFQNIVPLDDPEHFFAQLRTIVQASPEARFREVIERLMIDNVVENIGKIRNVQASEASTSLVPLVLKLGRTVTMMVGLANRQCYTTEIRIFSEAVALPDLPDGFRELSQVILAGDLRDRQQLGAVCERLWHGLNIWMQNHNYQYLSPERIPF